MAFHDDLLEQARHLAQRDPRRPKQANLRRAISTAYYALFHFLISEAVGLWRVEEQRYTLARAFEHKRMKAACQSLRSDIPDLRAVASAFVELQDARLKADYDNAVVWTRINTTTIVEIAEAAFKRWAMVKGQRPAQDFLLSMLTDRR